MVIQGVRDQSARLLLGQMFGKELEPQLIVFASIMGGIIYDEAIKCVTSKALAGDGKRARSLVDDALLYDGATCSTTTLKL